MRGRPTAGSRELVDERRVIEIALGGETRCAAAEDAARYRDAFGCSLPLGLPMAFTDPVARPLEEIVGRYARTHGPFLAADVAARFGAPPERIAGALAALEGDERVVIGEFRPHGVSTASSATSTCCVSCVVGRSPRCARRSSPSSRRPSPGSSRRGTAFRRNGGGSRRSSRRSACCRARRWLRRRSNVTSCPVRVSAFRPPMLDELCTAGEVVWIGAGALGAARRPGPAVLRRPTPAPRPRLGSTPSRPRARSTTRSARCSPSTARASGARSASAAPGAAGPGAARRAVGPRVGG